MRESGRPARAEVGAPAAPARGRGTLLQPFHYRDYRVLWASQVAQAAAFNIDQLARPLLMLHLTDSAFLVGAVVAARMTPSLLLALFAGTVVDRFPRRNVLLGAHMVTLTAAALLALLLITDVIAAWHVIAMGVLAGTSFPFHQPARQAILPLIVPREALRSAVALMQLANNGLRIGGGLLVGLLLAFTSFAVMYVVMAGCYAVVVGLLLMIRSDTRAAPAQDPGPGDAGWRASAREGLRWAVHDRRPLVVLLLAAVQFALILPYSQVFLPLLVVQELDRDRSWVGYLTIAIGIGALAGSLTIAAGRRLPNAGRLMLGILAATGLLLVALSAAPNLWLMALVLLGAGAATTMFMTTSNLTLLSLAPPDLTGRVLSLMGLARGLIPVGALLAGALAAILGPRPGLLITALLVVAASALLAITIPMARRLQTATEPGVREIDLSG